MPTTLTRELLLEKGKPRYEVVSVDGLGEIGIRSVTELRQSQREHEFYNDDGTPKDDLHEKMIAIAIIDQVMASEDSPMFTADDLDSVLAMNQSVTRPLFAAIQEFNGEDAAKKKDESGG